MLRGQFENAFGETQLFPDSAPFSQPETPHFAGGTRKRLKHAPRPLASPVPPPRPLLLSLAAGIPVRLHRRILRVRRDIWSPELMRFCRCACLTATELDNLEAAARQQATTTRGSNPADLLDGAHSSLCSSNGASRPAHPSAVATACGRGCVQRASSKETRFGGKAEDGRPQHPVAETAVSGNDPPNDGSPRIELKQSLVRADGKQGRRGGGGRDGWAERTNSGDDGKERASKAGEACRFPCKALSAQNEVAALTKAMDFFVQARDAFPTTLEHDEVRTADELSKPSC